MKIYTKSGDKGETSLVGGTRVKKSAVRIEAYGELDELNSWIGLVLSKNDFAKDQKELMDKIQNELFVIGSWAACEIEKRGSIKLPQHSKSIISEMETAIDQMQSKLETLSYFVLPGGTETASLVHIVRTISRKCERNLMKLIDEEKDQLMMDFVVFLNRLSDYLFVLARYHNYLGKKEETKWIPKK